MKITPQSVTDLTTFITITDKNVRAKTDKNSKYFKNLIRITYSTIQRYFNGREQPQGMHLARLGGIITQRKGTRNIIAMFWFFLSEF